MSRAGVRGEGGGPSPREIVPLDDGDLHRLREFVESLGSSSNSFRYFQNRPLEIVRNHIATFLGLQGGRPVAYGHLDPEGAKVWLGIAVVESHVGKGWGRAMMERLCTVADECCVSLHLSVDLSNEPARRLYETFGFAPVDTKQTRMVMAREPR